VKRNSSLIFRFFHFFCFFHFFRFFHFFSLNFHFASIFSLYFCLFYLRFRFRFLVFRIEVNHVKSGFFFCFQAKRNFRFNFKFRFRSESEGAPYSPLKTNSFVYLALAFTLRAEYDPRNVNVLYLKNLVHPCWIFAQLILNVLRTLSLFIKAKAKEQSQI
jgi:hypothetical protein